MARSSPGLPRLRLSSGAADGPSGRPGPRHRLRPPFCCDITSRIGARALVADAPPGRRRTRASLSPGAAPPARTASPMRPISSHLARRPASLLRRLYLRPSACRSLSTLPGATPSSSSTFPSQAALS
eukprot:2686931-Lingulodinium_polyedra.AAC.1